MLQRQAGEVIIIGDLKVTGFGIGKYIWDRVRGLFVLRNSRSQNYSLLGARGEPE